MKHCKSLMRGLMHACEVCAAVQVGSIFEYANRNPIFGVVKPDNFLWAPILLFFAITGFPSAGTCPALNVVLSGLSELYLTSQENVLVSSLPCITAGCRIAPSSPNACPCCHRFPLHQGYQCSQQRRREAR